MRETVMESNCHNYKIAKAFSYWQKEQAIATCLIKSCKAGLYNWYTFSVVPSCEC
jgi:hypothetical protein